MTTLPLGNHEYMSRKWPIILIKTWYRLGSAELVFYRTESTWQHFPWCTRLVRCSHIGRNRSDCRTKITDLYCGLLMLHWIRMVGDASYIDSPTQPPSMTYALSWVCHVNMPHWPHVFSCHHLLPHSAIEFEVDCAVSRYPVSIFALQIQSPRSRAGQTQSHPFPSPHYLCRLHTCLAPPCPPSYSRVSTKLKSLYLDLGALDRPCSMVHSQQQVMPCLC